MLLNHKHYTFDDSDTFIIEVIETSAVSIVKNKKGIEYYNVPCAFDIETSSFYDNGEKRACCYLWQFGFNGSVIVGRNLLDDFPLFISAVSGVLNLNCNRRLLCYVHNLAYEFQWIRKYFNWLDGEFDFMANEIRKPFVATTTDGIEFRCSYLLSGYSLKNVAKNLQSYKIDKLTDVMDYDKIRHSKTALDNDTIRYGVNDVLIVMAYISEEIDSADGDISSIPFTNTGRVRRYCRNNSKEYQNFVRRFCTLEYDTYTAAKKAFQGGFTHANVNHVATTLHNVGSYDFTSSYPYVMVSEKFPMSTPEKFRITSIAQFDNALKLKCCIFQITFFNIKAVGNDCFISEFRCQDMQNAVTDNGKIYSADVITTVITELDYYVITENYTFDDFSIGFFYMSKKDYLPIDFVNSILKLYSDKTTLKGVEGADVEYLRSKGMLNSCYGMAVTDVIRLDYKYDNDNHQWLSIQPNVNEKIEDYNNKGGRFLYYLWGVYVTAYARYNLITNINKLGNDYVYSDTDSIKFLNVGSNQHIFDEYNQQVLAKLKRVSRDRDIPFELFQPTTKDGKKKLLGVFDFEGVYDMFKTLGAKRYLSYKHGKLEITVAGVNKKTGVSALLPLGCNPNSVTADVATDAFDTFDFDLLFDYNACGKLTHTYLDNEFSGVVVDCNGLSGTYHELSAIHLEPTTYHMTVSNEYLNLIEKVNYFAADVDS